MFVCLPAGSTLKQKKVRESVSAAPLALLGGFELGVGVDIACSKRVAVGKLASSNCFRASSCQLSAHRPRSGKLKESKSRGVEALAFGY